MRKAAIELIPRGIAVKTTSNHFGCNKLDTLTHRFSSLCSNSRNVGHKDSLFLLTKQPIIDISCRINERRDAICLFDEMLRMSPQPSVVEFTKLLSSTANKEHYSVALWMFGEMRQFGAVVNENTMNIAIRCCCLQHEVDFAFAILGNFFKCGYKPDTETFNNLIRGLFLNNKVDEVAELFKRLLILKLCKPDHVMIHTVINGLCERGHDNSAGYLLGLLEETSSEVYEYCNTISGLCCNGLVDVALDLLSEVIVRGISPNVSTIEGVYQFVGGSEDAKNSSICKGVFCHKKYLKLVALDVLADAISKEIQILVIEKQKDMGVMEYLMHTNCSGIQDLDERWNVTDDSFVYDVLINGYCLLGHIDKAKKVFDSIVEMGHKPSIFSYGGLIIANCKKGNVNEAYQFFLQVPCNGLEHYIVTYNTMMYGLFREGRFDDGWKVFKEIEPAEAWKLFQGIEAQKKVEPDGYTTKILIYGLCMNRPITEVFSFLHKKEEVIGNLDIESYEIIIDVLCRDGKPHVARDVLNQLRSKRLQRPRKQTYNMIIGSLCREGFTEEAKCLFLEMLEYGAVAWRNTYNMVERHDNAILKFFEEMKVGRMILIDDTSIPKVSA